MKAVGISLNIAICLLIFFFFTYVALHLGRRQKYLESGSKGANLAFRCLWHSLANAYLFTGIALAFAIIGSRYWEFNFEYLGRVWAIFIGPAWFYFIVFLIWGRKRLSEIMASLSVVPIAYWVFLAYRGQAVPAESGFFGTDWVAAHPLAGTLATGMMIVALLSAVGLAWLFAESRTSTTRYRLALTAVALLLWLPAGLEEATNFLAISMITARLLVLAGGVIAYLAYFPPTLLRRRFGLKTLHETNGKHMNGNNGHREEPGHTAPGEPAAIGVVRSFHS